MIWNKAGEESENNRPHYFYDFVFNRPFNWSQIGADKGLLPEALKDADLDWIFQVLKEWSGEYDV